MLNSFYVCYKMPITKRTLQVKGACIEFIYLGNLLLLNEKTQDWTEVYIL